MNKEQIGSINFYISKGFVWDKELSASLAAVAIRRGDIIHVYGLDGSISLYFDINKALTFTV